MDMETVNLALNLYRKKQLIGKSKVVNYIFNNNNCPRGVMVKSMDCGIVVREFVLQSCSYVHFQANTLGKGMNPVILPAMG